MDQSVSSKTRKYPSSQPPTARSAAARYSTAAPQTYATGRACWNRGPSSISRPMWNVFPMGHRIAPPANQMRSGSS
jgi:hypothetical protein